MDEVCDDVENYLQEKLFGSKDPVSTVLLSFKLGQTIVEAANSLRQFYESHRDALDASFKVTTQQNWGTSIKLVKEKDLDKSAIKTSRIWIVSSQGAADRTVIDAVAAETQKIQINLSIGRLKRLGFVTNPLLEDGFTISEQGSCASRRQSGPVPTNPPRMSVTKPMAEMLEEPDSQKPMGESVAPPGLEVYGPSTRRERKATGPKESVPSAPLRKPKTNPTFFVESSKDDALKSMRRRQTESKPVHEAVVIGDEIKERDDLEDLEPEHDSKASREEQLKKLRESMFNEQEGNDDESAEHEYDDETGDNIELSPEEDVMDVDDEPSVTEENRDEFRRSASPLEGINPMQSEETLDSKHSTGVSPPRRRTRRVRQNVTRKDEEGFDVHEEIWVDIPVESDTESGVPEQGVATSDSRVEQKMKTQEKPVIKNESDSEKHAESKRVAKAPPKMPSSQKKQKTLMSFFGKKK